MSDGLLLFEISCCASNKQALKINEQTEKIETRRFDSSHDSSLFVARYFEHQ